MTIKVAYRIIFNRANILDRNGKAPVVIETYQSGHRKYFPTGIKLKPEEWDKRKNEVKNSPAYNQTIRNRITELEDFEMRFPALHGRPFVLADFDKLPGAAAITKVIKITLTSFIAQQLNISRANAKWSQSTWYNCFRNAGYLTEFNGGKPVDFDQLTYEFIDDFDNFLRLVKGLTGSVYKVHQLIKRYITLAGKRGLVDSRHNPYNDFTFGKDSTERTVLYIAEIRRIEALTFNLDNGHLAFYRDAFLLAFYTLLRISDVTALRQQHLSQTPAGMVLEMKVVKTKKTNRLPLYELHRTPDGPSKPERILQQYARTDKKPLFDRSHPRINEYVKEVFRLAKIDKPATFHTARHSGITYLVQCKLSVPYIQKLAQHSSIQTTMIYTHIADQMVEDALAGIQWYKLPTETNHNL